MYDKNQCLILSQKAKKQLHVTKKPYIINHNAHNLSGDLVMLINNCF